MDETNWRFWIPINLLKTNFESIKGSFLMCFLTLGEVKKEFDVSSMSEKQIKVRSFDMNDNVFLLVAWR